VHPQLTNERRKSRAAIVVLVLAGLWMMHGISAAGGAGCHAGTMSLVSAMSGGEGAMAAAAPVPSSVADSRTRPGTAARPDGMAAGQSGDLCLSGQPTDPGAAFIALIALVALAGCVLLGGDLVAWMQAAMQRARRWRAPPGRAGTALLDIVCVSRT